MKDCFSNHSNDFVERFCFLILEKKEVTLFGTVAAKNSN
jgi:hypothetical protein